MTYRRRISVAYHGGMGIRFPTLFPLLLLLHTPPYGIFFFITREGEGRGGGKG